MILVGTPIHADSCHLLAETIEAWRSFDRDDVEFHIVFNGHFCTKSITHVKKLVDQHSDLPITLEIIPSGHFSGWGSLCAAQRRICERVMTNGYNSLLWHEVSRVPRKNTLSQLLQWNLPVAGALYKDTYHPGYYCVYSFDRERQLHLPEPYFYIDKITEPKQVEGLGFGFTHIQANVLKRITLRIEKYAADTYFFCDLADLGIPAFACPVFVENIKVDCNPAALRQWWTSRQHIAQLVGEQRSVQ